MRAALVLLAVGVSSLLPFAAAIPTGVVVGVVKSTGLGTVETVVASSEGCHVSYTVATPPRANASCRDNATNEGGLDS